MLRAAVDPLVLGRVIGDVVDMFVPSAELVVRYGATQISNGCEIKPSMGDERPTVHIRGSSNYYSLVSNHTHKISNEIDELIWGLIIIMGFVLFRSWLILMLQIQVNQLSESGCIGKPF